MSFKVIGLLKGRKVVLASQSPRRKELLGMICGEFEICPAVGEETVGDDVGCFETAKLLAEQKCAEVAEKFPRDAVVIASDTTVVLDGEVLGKPCDACDAARMLRALSGKTHYVVSGAAFSADGKMHSFSETTKVVFCELSQADIDAYIATGEPFDKAGAYGIQGLGALLCEGIEGDYFNVVGLPLSRLAQELEKALGQGGIE